MVCQLEAAKLEVVDRELFASIPKVKRQRNTACLLGLQAYIQAKELSGAPRSSVPQFTLHHPLSSNLPIRASGILPRVKRKPLRPCPRICSVARSPDYVIGVGLLNFPFRASPAAAEEGRRQTLWPGTTIFGQSVTKA
nr:uncharacterized protein LOC121502753 [Drosophila kikkawai]